MERSVAGCEIVCAPVQLWGLSSPKGSAEAVTADGEAHRVRLTVRWWMMSFGEVT